MCKNQCRLDIEDVGTMMTCKRDFDARVDEIIGKRPVQGHICQWWRICQWFNRSTYFSFDDFGTKPSLGSGKIIVLVKSLVFRLKFKRLVANHWLKSLTGTGRNPVKSLVNMFQSTNQVTSVSNPATADPSKSTKKSGEDSSPVRILMCNSHRVHPDEEMLPTAY